MPGLGNSEALGADIHRVHSSASLTAQQGGHLTLRHFVMGASKFFPGSQVLGVGTGMVMFALLCVPGPAAAQLHSEVGCESPGQGSQ